MGNRPGDRGVRPRRALAFFAVLALMSACLPRPAPQPPYPIDAPLPGAVTDLVRLRDGSGVLVAAVDRDAGHFSSRDEGRTWLPGFGLGNQAGYAVTLLPDGRTLIGGTNLGVVRSDDRGRGWSLVVAAQPGAFTVTLDESGRPIAGLHQTIAIGDRAGRRWQIARGRIAGASILGLAALPPNAERLIAGTNAAGILASTDLGRTWTPISPSRAVAARLIRSGDGAMIGIVGPNLLRWTDPDRDPAIVELPGAAGRPIALAATDRGALAGTTAGEVWAIDPEPRRLMRLAAAVSAIWSGDREICLGTVAGEVTCQALDLSAATGAAIPDRREAGS